MKAKAIRVAYGVTRNLGNYESLRLQYEVECELEPSDNIADEFVSQKLQKMKLKLRGEVDKAIKEEIAWDASRP